MNNLQKTFLSKQNNDEEESKRSFNSDLRESQQKTVNYETAFDKTHIQTKTISKKINFEDKYEEIKGDKENQGFEKSKEKASDLAKT